MQEARGASPNISIIVNNDLKVTQIWGLPLHGAPHQNNQDNRYAAISPSCDACTFKFNVYSATLPVLILICPT